MKPVYLDLHIHTSENPESLNTEYDLESLQTKISEIAGDNPTLISFTDHNTINKEIYMKALDVFPNILLGAELHIWNFTEKKPYHCHIYFNLEQITEESINIINKKLDALYPQKVISYNPEKEAKLDHKDRTKVIKIEEIIRKFDTEDFVLLPHGGQNHSTFNKSIPEDVGFDDFMVRTIYYNLLDGFTARNNEGLGDTQEYFKKLGINGFVNLITCTDNYSPSRYPEPKDKKASPFIPTWMLALPTFEGLRLSLSEDSRLVYADKCPQEWPKSIKKVTLKNEHIDLDVNLTSGLNVVIGGSSSGKSLFVDSLVRKIDNTLRKSLYIKTQYSIQDISVVNSSGLTPHYIHQNYILEALGTKDGDKKINDIDLVRKVFPGDGNIREQIQLELIKLRRDVHSLIEATEEIEKLQEQFSHELNLNALVCTKAIKENIFNPVQPSEEKYSPIEYGETRHTQYTDLLDEIDEFLAANPLVEHDKQLVVKLKHELDSAREISKIEKKIRDILIKYKNETDSNLAEGNRELQNKKQGFEKILKLVRSYKKFHIQFFTARKKISEYKKSFETESHELMGHKLLIENNFILSKEKFLEVVNNDIKRPHIINKFEDVTPKSLFIDNFPDSPKIDTYETLERRISNHFEKLSKQIYKIITNDGRNFEDLSPGWKTSIILDLILGYEGDNAPIIIDQPEDNLSTTYINEGLITAVKRTKMKKQVILVSHNATIPMLGDAQNVILCKNNKGFITIKSACLEGKLDNKNVVDHIARITDGGKGSIKKRVKKYNLKKFI